MLRVLERHAVLIWSMALGLVLAGPILLTRPQIRIWEECISAPNKSLCYEEQLDRILETHGPPAALEALDVLVGEDSDVRRDTHPYAHHLGKSSFAHYKNFPLSFSHCREAYASGCYHGVLEGYLSSRASVTPEDIGALCASLGESGKTDWLKFQCVHGLGHGLTMYYDHDILKALLLCDALKSSRERDSCYGGVFMENIVAYQQRTFRSEAGSGHQHHAQTAQRILLNPKDPHYPCNVVIKKYQGPCYFVHAGAFLTLNRSNFSQTVKECDGAPTDFIALCYQSLGREISGFSLATADKTIELCMLGTAKYRHYCFQGAVVDFIFTHSPEHGMILCRKLSDVYKQDCYTNVGQFLVDFYAEQSARNNVCGAAEADYIELCKAVSIPPAQQETRRVTPSSRFERLATPTRARVKLAV